VIKPLFCKIVTVKNKKVQKLCSIQVTSHEKASFQIGHSWA